MTPINEKAQAIINAIPQIISDNRIDKEAIQSSFNLYCENWNIQKRKVVVFESNLEGWKFVTAKTNASWDAAWDASWGAARDAARGAAWDAAWGAARDAAWDAAWGAARDAARDAARGAARDAARDASWGAALENSCQCEKSECVICGFKQKELPLRDMFKNGSFTYWITPDEIVVILAPKIYHSQGRLHREDGPALVWPNEMYWFLHGVKLDQEMHEKIIGQKMSFREIMVLKNIEHRMVALKYMDFGDLMKGAGGRLVDKASAKGNELWLLDNKDIFPNPEFFLHYKCPSTDREYSKCVEREWALLPDGNLSADQAQARSHKWTLEEYLEVFQEA